MNRRLFLLRTGQASLALGVLSRLSACQRPEPESQDGTFIGLRDRYFVRALSLNPVTATYLGGDAYDPSLADVDSRLRDWRPEAIAAELAFYAEIETERIGIDPAMLSPEARIDHAVLGAQLAFLRRQWGDRRYHERAVDTYVAEPFRGVDWQIQGMTVPTEPAPPGKAAAASETLRGTEEEWGQLLERVRAIPAYLAAARGNLEAGKKSGNVPDHRMVARDGVDGSKANAEYFRKSLLESARGFLGSRPFATNSLGDLTAASRQAADAWEGFAGFLLDTYDPKDLTDRFAAGEAEYAWRVKNCLRQDRNLEDLFAYGGDQVAHYEAQLFEVAQAVAREAGLTLPWSSDLDRRASTRAVMDALARQSPRNDDELFQWYREAGARAVAYGREQQLFDVPADYQLEVTPTPPVLRSTIDAAYYPAPPFKKTGVGRFYLTPTGNDPAALRLNNKSSIADTAVHEGFPGHDWHYKYMTQHLSEISNIRWLTPGAVEDSSSMWEDSMASEGWALYSEELMAEPVAGHPYGFYTPGERLYELQGQLLRAVRVRVDVGIHTGRMTYDQALDYYTQHVDFYPQARQAAAKDPAARAIMTDAERAIYRYSKWPTQAITYNLGRAAIVELREALRQKQGNRFDARAFHERLMLMGTIPAPYFRDWFLAT
ncbi:MAG TPA: DUF885 domain-containing protein [Gemmatimonadales bacterium]|nr:DUF885 domain-containing protein [Gemmatimonadales bacterium]